MLEDYNQGFSSSLNKFEEMLKTNLTFFFDAQEIEYIAQHYIDFGKINLAKKAVKIGNKQHPVNINILLLKSEIFILEDKLDTAKEILTFIKKIERAGPVSVTHKEVIRYFEHNIHSLFKKKKDIEIAYAIVELLNKKDDIENFNKKSLYILIREMTDVDTTHITKVMNVFRTHYKKILNEFDKYGMVNIGKIDKFI